MGRNKPKKKPAAAAPTPPKEEPKIYEIFDSDEDEDKDIDALEEPIQAKVSLDDKQPSDTKQGPSKENDQPQANLSTKDIFAQWKGSGVWQPSSGLEHFTINDLCKTRSKFVSVVFLRCPGTPAPITTYLTVSLYLLSS